MSESMKVQPHHLERGAYLYVRQSSMRQVIENVESTKRQYALRGRAIALGWREDEIVVVDCDQGESGASAAWREGFQHLVAEVSMGRAGMVMGGKSCCVVEKSGNFDKQVDREEYVGRVLDAYRATPGATGSVRKPDRLLAAQLYQRGIPVEKVEHALALAAVRRHIRPPNAPPLATVRSMAYFLPVIEEVLQMQVSEAYFLYIRQKLERLRAS